MESLDSSKSSNTFLKHVFNFNEESKGELLNIIQYSLLAVIPVVIINKVMQKYVPEANEDKGSLEITLEVVLQLVGMFVGIFFTDRIITYFPTYSGIKYLEFSVTNIILAVLVIVLSLQTKLGEKVSILVDRVFELWNGPSDKKNKKGPKMSGGNTFNTAAFYGATETCYSKDNDTSDLLKINFEGNIARNAIPIIGGGSSTTNCIKLDKIIIKKD